MGFLAVAMLMMVGLVGLLIPDDASGTEGSDASERLSGGDANDSLSGGGGDDLLLAAMGDDTVSGGEGNDWIFGGAGDDLIDGGDGKDVILPGTGADTVMAGAGNDFIEAADLVDEAALEVSLANARSFADIVFRYDIAAQPDAPDQIDAGAGNDTIVAGPGDTITGGEGADEIALGDWGGDASDDPAAKATPDQEPPPVIITDFDPDDDVLTYTWRAPGQPPVLLAENDPDTTDVFLRADGRVAAILRNLPEGLDVTRVEIKAWRRTA